jgi:hypothetical protein|tara:strand:- start:224 stop:430 length:207 start_codon:yes stop_codon:yes gene_type:complete
MHLKFNLGASVEHADHGVGMITGSQERALFEPRYFVRFAAHKRKRMHAAEIWVDESELKRVDDDKAQT